MSGPRTYAVDPLVRQLKYERLNMGLSAGEMSAKLGLAAGTVAHWEAGRRMPPLYKLRQYAEMLGLEPVLLPRAERSTP